jgi:tRNA threonylcarbamoyladenosine biosynthesis protein TsaE
MVDVTDKQETLNCPDISHLPEIVSDIIDFTGDCRIILFEGELGSGKTTIIKSICNHLNVIDNVSSPSFSIINQYLTDGGLTIYHFDFFRIKSVEEALDIGTEEYFYSGDLCLIEWPSKVESLIPGNHVLVNIDVEANESRVLQLKYYV